MDRTCLVTGASRGIGRGIAERFARDGASIAVNYHSSESAAAEAVATVEAAGGEAIAVQADVTDPAAVAAMGERVRDAFGPIDVLVNNAGITDDATFGSMRREQWESVVEVNLNGTYTVTKEFYDDVREAEEGRLINISSVVGKRGNYGQVNYAAAKAGILGFTRAIALELAPHGSTANCVAPGYTKTEMIERVPERVRRRIVEEIPLERFAEVEEVACVVDFLAGEDASYVTGEVIDVNGALDL